MVDLQLKFHMMLATRNDLTENDSNKIEQLNETTIKTEKKYKSKNKNSDEAMVNLKTEIDKNFYQNIKTGLNEAL